MRPCPCPAPRELLPSVIQAVEAAGECLRHEFHRPTWPRGHGDKAEVGREIERELRAVLPVLGPARFLGEESGAAGDTASALCWLVDPHDGTRAFLDSQRGTAVAVACCARAYPCSGSSMPP